MDDQKRESSQLLTPAEVARLFRVDLKTITRWADAGRLNTVRTLGRHRRYLAVEVEQLMVEARAHSSDDTAAGPDHDQFSTNEAAPLKEGPCQAPELLTRAEVAALFGVDGKTVTRWAQAGRLRTLRTVGGHRRYLLVEVMHIITEATVHIGADLPDAAGDH